MDHRLCKYPRRLFIESVSTLQDKTPPQRQTKARARRRQVLNKGAESKEAKTVSVTLSTHIQVRKVDLIKREYFWNPDISQMVEEPANTSEGQCEK